MKSALVQELEPKLTKDDVRELAKDSEMQTACLGNVIANIRQAKTKDLRTFRDFCEHFLDYIAAIGQGTDRSDLIFDSDVERSMKDSERRRHQVKAPIEMCIINCDTPLPVEMDRFWALSGYLKLQMLLHKHTIKRRIEQPSKLQVVASGFS